MDYEIKIAVNPEVDIDKLNSALKLIENSVKGFSGLNPFNAGSIQKALNDIPKLVEESQSKIPPPTNKFDKNVDPFKNVDWNKLNNYDFIFRGEDLNIPEYDYENKLIDEETYLKKKNEINQYYYEILSGIRKSNFEEEANKQKFDEELDNLKIQYDKKEIHYQEYLDKVYELEQNQRVRKGLTSDPYASTDWNKLNSYDYIERGEDLSSKKYDYEQGIISEEEYLKKIVEINKYYYDRIANIRNNSSEENHRDHPTQMDMREMDIEPVPVKKYRDIVNEIALLNKELKNVINERNEALININQRINGGTLKPRNIDKEWAQTNSKYDFIANQIQVKIDQAYKEMEVSLSQNSEVQKRVEQLNEIYSDRIEAVLVNAKADGLSIDSQEILNQIANLEFQKQLELYKSKLITPNQYNEAVKSIRAYLNEKTKKSGPMKMDDREMDVEPANLKIEYPKTGNVVGNVNLGEGFEDVAVLAAISENWDTASNTLADEQSLLNYFAAIKKVNESPEMAMIRENWDTGSNTPGEEEAYLKYIGFEKERITNRNSQPVNGRPKNQLPPKMMMSDIELNAIYAEFEGDNENYRDEELAANQKMLDDKLIAEEQFLENRLKILQDFENRKSEVIKYIDNVDSLSTSDTTERADSSGKADSDTELVKKATDKPEKVFDAMSDLIADNSEELKTATISLTKSIGETLGGLFDGNEEKLKEGSKKLLKTLADLIKKVASAAITNIVIGQLGLSGATTGLGAIFGAPAILTLVQGVVSAIIDPIVNGLVMKTGGRADVPTGVVIGDNPYSPEWVLRDFDIQAIIDTALQKAYKATSSEMDKSNDIQSELIEIIKTQERYSQANNFFNTGESVMLQVPEKQGSMANAIYIDNTQIIKNLEELNQQFSNFEGRIHVVESEVAQATNNFNNRIIRRSYI